MKLPASVVSVGVILITNLPPITSIPPITSPPLTTSFPPATPWHHPPLSIDRIADEYCRKLHPGVYSDCRDGICTEGWGRTKHGCSAEDITRVANKYTSIRSELEALSKNGLSSDIEYGFPRQIVESPDYGSFLLLFGSNKPGEVAGVRIASRFRDPARAHNLLTKLYLTMPGMQWPTMEVPVRPGVHSDWDVAMQLTRRRFATDEVRSLVTQSIPHGPHALLEGYLAGHNGRIDEFKRALSDFMVLASAERVTTLQPEQLEQYRRHLQYLGAHDFYLPLRTARWLYEAVTTSATAQDLFPYNDVPTSGFVGVTIADSAQLPGPYKAIEMNRIDVDWDRNVTAAEFDSMVTAYWSKPRVGYPVSARVIIVQTLYEIRALIGLGLGDIRSVIPAEWLPLADEFRRTLNFSSPVDDVIGRSRSAGDEMRYINAIYRVLAMLDTPRDTHDDDGEAHSVTAVKVMKLLGGDDAVKRGMYGYPSLIHPEPDISGGPDAAGTPSIRMMFEETLNFWHYIWMDYDPESLKNLLFTRVRRGPPRGYPIYGDSGAAMVDVQVSVRGECPPNHARFSEILKGEADCIGAQRTIIGIMADYLRGLGLRDYLQGLWLHRDRRRSRHSYHFEQVRSWNRSPGRRSEVVAAVQRAVIQAEAEARLNDTLLATRFYPRMHLLLMLTLELVSDATDAIVERLVDQPDSEIAGIAKAVGHYRSVALIVAKYQKCEARGFDAYVLAFMEVLIRKMVFSGFHGEGIIKDDLILVVLGQLDEFTMRVRGAPNRGRLDRQMSNLYLERQRSNSIFHLVLLSINRDLIQLSESLAMLLDEMPQVTTGPAATTSSPPHTTF